MIQTLEILRCGPVLHIRDPTTNITNPLPVLRHNYISITITIILKLWLSHCFPSVLSPRRTTMARQYIFFSKLAPFLFRKLLSHCQQLPASVDWLCSAHSDAAHKLQTFVLFISLALRIFQSQYDSDHGDGRKAGCRDECLILSTFCHPQQPAYIKAFNFSWLTLLTAIWQWQVCVLPISVADNVKRDQTCQIQCGYLNPAPPAPHCVGTLDCTLLHLWH